MSLERIIKTLESLGLKRLDAEVYIYLAKRGPQDRKEIADALKIRKKQLSAILKTLQDKGIITIKLERSELFSALAFKEALDLLVEVNMEQAMGIKENKEELLSSWRQMSKQENT
jgi:sugar-specific transcriptional regulator TrmB